MKYVCAIVAAAALTVCTAAMPARASAGMSAGMVDEISYQGELLMNDEPLNGTADFAFRLYDAAAGGTLIGTPVSINNHTVVDGRFTVGLDFGIDAFDGDPRWIEIDVPSPAGAGSFTTLTTR